MKKPWYRRRRFLLPLSILLVFLIFVGPWPADNTPYAQAGYFSDTVRRFDAPASATGPLRAGFAEIEITPPVGHQLAGFTGRRPFASDSVFSRCYARALTLAVGDVEVTVLAVDLLLVNDDLAGAVLADAGLEPGEIFFTATHTHGGPGQWADHPLEKLIIGNYDADYAKRLSQQLADAVSQSRAELVPVETALVTVEATGTQWNRIDRKRATFDQLSALLLRPLDRPDGPPIVALASFGAHATVAGHQSHAINADYPGALVDRVRAETGATNVMFAAGSVGDASALRPAAKTREEMAVKVGERLADMLTAPIQEAAYDRTVTLANAYLPVELPSVRVPVTTTLRLSPLSTRWVAPDRSHLHALRIGPAMLIGFPGDYSGQLAGRLADGLSDTGLTVIPTSFNGDYLGYVISEDDFFGAAKYETRILNFYGPWLGPYLNDLAARLAGSMAD